MTQILQYNNRSILATERARILFNRIQSEANRREKQDIRSNLTRIYQAFTELYSTLGKPSVKLRPFDSRQMPKSAVFNSSMREIENDISTAYSELRNLGTSFIEVFNYSRALSLELSDSTQRLASKVIDLRLLNNQLDQNVIIAGDDFNDNSKIDFNAPVQNSRADVLIAQGVVTLSRVESVNVVNDKTQISVSPIKPDGLQIRPTVGNTNRFYEGKFYDYINSARPEGGSWHLEESISVNVPATGVSVTSYTQNPGQAPNTAGPGGIDSRLVPFIGGDGPPRPGQNLRPQDIIVYDRGASETEKAKVRSSILDQNPSTFWECEYVKTAPSLQNDVDKAKLVGSNNAGGLTTVGLGEEQNVLQSTVTLDDLRSKAAVLSSTIEDDLIIELSVTLDVPKVINWISINPNNFTESAWIDVLDIQYSSSDSASFITIPSFDGNIHENILTDDANSELSSDEAGAILAPSKYSYKGIGVWSFSPVTAKVIKFRIRQKTAVPSPYQRLAIRLHRVFTQVYTETEADSGGI